MDFGISGLRNICMDFGMEYLWTSEYLLDFGGGPSSEAGNVVVATSEPVSIKSIYAGYVACSILLKPLPMMQPTSTISSSSPGERSAGGFRPAAAAAVNDHDLRLITYTSVTPTHSVQHTVERTASARRNDARKLRICVHNSREPTPRRHRWTFSGCTSAFGTSSREASLHLRNGSTKQSCQGTEPRRKSQGGLPKHSGAIL